MRKLLKVIAIVIGILVALVIVAIIAISLFFDPNDYKDEIEQAVLEQTGRELTIAGDIELSFFPWIGIETGQVSLSNAPGFPAETMLKVEHAGASVKLLPLLSRELVIDSIILEGAEVHLAKKANGETSWDDLLPAGQGPSDPEAAGAGLAGLVISGVQLQDSTITWTDLATGSSYTASDIDLETSAIGLGDPFDLELGFDVINPQSGLDARIELSTDATVGVGFENIELSGLELNVDGQYGRPDPMPLALSLSGDAAIHFPAGTAEISDLTLNAWNITATGELQARNIAENLNYRGQLIVEEFSPEELLTTLTGAPPETSDPDVLDSAAMELALTGTANQLQLVLNEFYLDDTHIDGTFSIEDFESMAMAFDLNMDSINLDRYLPPETQEDEQDAAVATPGEAAAAGSAMIPVETLRGLNLNGTFHADALTVADMTATDIDITVSAANGRLRIHPINGQFYRGTYEGDIRIDATGEAPVLRMNETLQGIEAGPLLEDVLGKTWLTGTGGFTLNTRANLASAQTAKRSLSGAFNLNFEDGAIFGINIAQRIRQAAAMLQGQAPASADDVVKTDFSSLTVAADIQEGIFYLEPISLQSPLLRVSGSGTVNLRDMTVDVLIKPVLVKTLEGQGGDALEQLTGVPLPLSITGPLMDPEIGLNLESTLKERAKGEIKEELQQLLQDEDEAADDSEGEQDEASTEDVLKDRALDAIFGGEDEESEQADEPPPA